MGELWEVRRRDEEECYRRSASMRLTVTFGLLALGLSVTIGCRIGDPTHQVSFIRASPNPVPAGPGVGTTEITWGVGAGSSGAVFVSVDGAEATPFAGGGNGTADAPWIADSREYEFRLYAGDSNAGSPLATVRVTRSTIDPFRPVDVTIAIALLVIGGDILRRGWRTGRRHVSISAYAAALPGSVANAYRQNRRHAVLLYGPWLAFVVTVWLKNLLFHSVVRIWPAEGVLIVPPLGALGSILVLHAPLLLLAPTRRFIGSLALSAIHGVVLLSDTLYYRFAGDILSTVTAINVGDFQFAISGALALLRPLDIAYVADVVVALAVLPSYKAAVGHITERSLSGRGLVAVFIVLIGARIDTHAMRPILMNGERWLANGYIGEFGERLGVANAHAFEYGRHLYLHVYRRRQVTAEQQDQVRVLLDRPRPAPGPQYGIARGKNLIIVMVESLQGFALGLRVGGKEVTPNLNALRAKSIEFSALYDQAWQGWTSDGWMTSLQGLHPLPAGALASVFPDNHFHGVPAVLAESGYTTLAACAYNPAMWNMGRTLEGVGFKRLALGDRFVRDEPVGEGLGDRSFFKQALPEIVALRAPFVAFLITVSTHFPYSLPEPYRTFAPGPAEGHVLGDYLQAVHYFDSAVGDFIDGLKRAGRWDDTVFVLFGDHRTFSEGTDDVDVARQLGLGLPADSMFASWLLHNRLAGLVHLPGDALAAPQASPLGQLDFPRTGTRASRRERSRPRHLGPRRAA